MPVTAEKTAMPAKQRDGGGEDSDSDLARELGENPSLSEVILRDLAAFGPATVNDIQAWCGLTRLRDATYQLKDQLRTLADENGREFLDVPDGPLPDPDTPALLGNV